MKKIFVIFILGLVISCSSVDKLEGTWVGAYSYTGISDSNKMPHRTVVTFKDGKYSAKSFKYDYRSGSDFESGTYEDNGDTLIFNSDKANTAIIDVINKDSLIIKGFGGANNSVYKRLEDSLKSKSENTELIGKRFLRTSKTYSDTLNFVNDSVLVKSWNSGNLETHWERINHKGFDILFIDLDIPYIINEESDGTIKLIGLHENRYNLELRELK